jgi:MoxR-like ATPase
MKVKTPIVVPRKPIKVERAKVTAGNAEKSDKKGPTLADVSLRYRTAFDAVNEDVLDRFEEIEALKLCVVGRQHLLLEGEHGLAKSFLAEEFFKRINGARIFDIQLMKGTQSDQIFGPMDSKKYRDEAVWKHNIDGMLPDTHFAFIDEVYRGSDSLLPAMMRILNERYFMNGPVKVQCPLITAIGTTNFITESPELNAFHDRWLVRAHVEPLKTKNKKVEMLSNFLKAKKSRYASEEDSEEKEMDIVTLSDIEFLHQKMWEVEVDPTVYDIYDEVVSQWLKAQAPRPYISDRRLCLTFTLALAKCVIEGQTTLSPEHLSAVKYGLFAINDNKAQQASAAFDGVYQKQVGDFMVLMNETKDTNDLQIYVKGLIEEFDPSRTRQDLENLLSSAEEAYTAVTEVGPDSAPKSPANQRKQKDISNDLSNLITTIKGTLNAKKK